MALGCLLPIDAESKDRRRKQGGRERRVPFGPGGEAASLPSVTAVVDVMATWYCCHRHLVLLLLALSLPYCIVINGIF